MKRPRFAFWLMFCLAIMILFQGDGSITTRLQDNWLTSVILLIVSLFYNGRFGYFQESRKTIAYIKRITYQLLGVVVIL
ncbi:MAG: hypothetical protein Q8934_19635 [Bacillota bacterium]|nr:hypothetical protein [Bacillota bacterium]